MRNKEKVVRRICGNFQDKEQIKKMFILLESMTEVNDKRETK